MHDPLEAIQPFPVVTHAVLYFPQSASNIVVSGAPVHSLALHFYAVESKSQIPSVPFINGHVAAVPVYAVHEGRVAIHPYPVETQPESQVLQAVSVVNVGSASSQL